MEDDSIEHLSEISSVDLKINQNGEKYIQKFLNFLEIEDCKFKKSSSNEDGPPLLKNVATQTETNLETITPPWVIYIENKTNTMCKELTELLKLMSKSNTCANYKQDTCLHPVNWEPEDSEKKFHIRAINQIEEKIEASLKMVLELKNEFIAEFLKEKMSQNSCPTTKYSPPIKDIPQKDHAKNVNLLRISPNAIYMDEVFPRSQKCSKMTFEIFSDRDSKVSQRARAVVAPTRNAVGLANNATERSERDRFFCSTPKDRVQMKTQESAVRHQLQEKKLQKDPALKGEPSRVTPRSTSKKQRNQCNPQKPPWR